MRGMAKSTNKGRDASFRVEPALYEAFKLAAEREQRSVSSALRWCMQYYIERQEPKA